MAKEVGKIAFRRERGNGLEVITEKEGKVYIVKYGKDFPDEVEKEQVLVHRLNWLGSVCGEYGPLAKIDTKYELDCVDNEDESNAIWQYTSESRMYSSLEFFQKLKQDLKEIESQVKNKIVYDQLLEFVDMFIQLYS